eukprot:CAMPEP_0118663430 /NCGR_PEP_ID=MMETSP0785-20121206/17418_1 /TAXON_ID=91992 /ORGANISM="Bolidomonas pacifica, Strain CCMP 1866" /LENGTH=518 /DNA_ID=CAMNT_0006557155 /DNA_START=116 /DNA_END=1673 /DNA_ORIENTATION=+
MAEFTNNAANATISKILSLLSKPTDEHILAGLTLLSKLKENPPSPKSVVDALSTRGMNFLKRLVLTGVKDESKRGYVDLSLSTYLFLAPTLSLNATTTTTLLSILDLRMPVDIQRRLHAITVLRKGFKSPTNEVMTKVVGIVVECEIRKAKSTTEDEWAEANMTGLLKEAEGRRVEIAPSANLDPILAFLKISTNLDLCLKILDSILVRGNESRLMKKFSSKLPSVCRRLIVTGLRLEALDKPDPQTPRDVSLHLLGRLLETCGGKWITDAVADNNPLKISVRVACGELRLHLAEVLDLAEAKSGPDVDERLQLFENKISVCIQVFLCATKHLIEIMDDDRADSADWASLPYDVLIHLKGSLDDGVDAMVQLLGEDVVHSGKLNVKVEEIMLLCVKPVGAWYAENEIETEYSRNMVAGAYHNAVILCDGGFSSAGGTNEDEEADSDDEEVPPSPPSQSNIFFLLPALAKVLNERSSHNDFVSVKLASNPKIIDIFLKFLKGPKDTSDCNRGRLGGRRP